MFLFFIRYISEFTYFGIFFVLLLCGLGLPLPEDIIVFSSGYLSYLGTTQPIIALSVNFIGILAGDLIIYGIGYFYGDQISNFRFLKKIATEERLIKSERFFETHGKKAIFFGRFLMGLRTPLFLAAGITRFPFKIFVIMDLAAAIISVPILFSLSFYFGNQIEYALELLSSIQKIIFFLGIMILFWIIWKGCKYIKYEKKTK
ncbi:MAG: DedA family protein [Nitrospinota bacterium]|nr:DedA family protein [Nitrospinota bacterium]